MVQNKTRSTSRRRRRRLVPILGFVMAAIGLAWLLESRMPTTVVVVRHTEVESGAANGDPPLSERGRQRAQLLADVLESIDVVAGIDAIYVSEYRSTQQTAVPLAERLDLAVRIEDPYQTERFIDELLHDNTGEIVLVVTHADLIARLVAGLNGHQSVPEIAEDEYSNIYIVTRPRFGKVKTLRLHYGLPWPSERQRMSEPFTGRP